MKSLEWSSAQHFDLYSYWHALKSRAIRRNLKFCDVLRTTSLTCWDMWILDFIWPFLRNSLGRNQEIIPILNRRKTFWRKTWMIQFWNGSRLRYDVTPLRYDVNLDFKTRLPCDSGAWTDSATKQWNAGKLIPEKAWLWWKIAKFHVSMCTRPALGLGKGVTKVSLQFPQLTIMWPT